MKQKTKNWKIFLKTSIGIGITSLSVGIITPIVFSNLNSKDNKNKESISLFNSDIKISNNYFKDIKAPLLSDLLSNNYLVNSESEKITLSKKQEQKINTVMSDVIKHVKHYGLSTFYINSLIKKYHVSHKSLRKVKDITKKIDDESKTKFALKSQTKSNYIFLNLYQNQSSSTLQLNNFVTYYKNVWKLKNEAYLNNLKNVAIATSVGAALSTAAAVGYWAGAWFFGLTIPDALAATANMVVDLTNTGILWTKYYSMSGNFNKMENKIIDLENSIYTGYHLPTLKTHIIRMLKWFNGIYDFDFHDAIAVRLSMISVETAASIASWAVPIISLLDITSTLYDLGMFIATTSFESTFETLATAAITSILNEY